MIFRRRPKVVRIDVNERGDVQRVLVPKGVVVRTRRFVPATYDVEEYGQGIHEDVPAFDRPPQRLTTLDVLLGMDWMMKDISERVERQR